MGQGLWGSEHTAPQESGRTSPPSSSSYSSPTFPQPSSASAPLPPFLLGSGTALSPHGSRRVHGPELIEGMPAPAKPNWLTCLLLQILIKSHSCILILTPAPSSSLLPSAHRPPVQPHCALASLTMSWLPWAHSHTHLPQTPAGAVTGSIDWVPKCFSKLSVRDSLSPHSPSEPWDPSGGGRMRLGGLVGRVHQGMQAEREPCGTPRDVNVHFCPFITPTAANSLPHTMP